MGKKSDSDARCALALNCHNVALTSHLSNPFQSLRLYGNLTRGRRDAPQGTATTTTQPIPHVTWRSDLWENWLSECIASILRGGSSLAYLDSQRCISGRDWDSGSSCLLHALVHIPMHPDSCSQVHAQRRRSARRLTGDGMYASWYAHLRLQNTPLYPYRLVLGQANMQAHATNH